MVIIIQEAPQQGKITVLIRNKYFGINSSILINSISTTLLLFNMKSELQISCAYLLNLENVRKGLEPMIPFLADKMLKTICLYNKRLFRSVYGRTISTTHSACFTTVSKHSMVMNLSRFIAFLCFHALIKHADRLVELVSQTKLKNKRTDGKVKYEFS